MAAGTNLSLVSRGLTQVGNVVRTAGGKIASFIVGGRRVSRKQAVQLARRVGLDAAAAALGIGAVELATAVLDEEIRHGRRGRGVTASQLKTTRRTMRTVMGMARTIRSACSETGFLRRRSAPAFSKKKCR